MASTQLRPVPGPEEAKATPREFSLAVQAGAVEGKGTVPTKALAHFLQEYGSQKKEEELQGELAFDQLASSLRRPCTHPHAEGAGDCLAFAARDPSGELKPLHFQRRVLKEHDVRVQLAYCGICHSDLHKLRDEWKASMPPTTYPCVAGHEMVGVVTAVGPQVAGFKVGDRAAVGCMVGSCGSCEACKAGLEQYCKALVWSYDSKDPEEGITHGGYSTHVIVNEKFVLHFPSNLPMDAAAPLLCAGITVWSPLRHFGLDKPGLKLGVAGLGGLGHMAVKIGKAFGCEVTVISRSSAKREEACRPDCLGADHFLVSREEGEMAGAAGTLDGIVDTLSVQHDLSQYLSLLRPEGKLILLGLSPEPLALPPFAVSFGRKIVSGSVIGSIKETQEMLDFCGQHSITCMIERIGIDAINGAMERMQAGQVHYRFVIDIQGSLVA